MSKLARASSPRVAGGAPLLAVRNLARQPRRTALALSAIGFGALSLLLAGGFIEWIFWAMRESTIESQLGHAQVVRSGYFEAGQADPFEYLLSDGSPARGILEGLPGVKALAPRLAFTGLASRGETTVSFLGEGVEPGREVDLSRNLHIARGQGLEDGDPAGVILGNGLARNLGAVPGDTVVLLATTASGGINAVEARVRGTFYTSNKAFDDAALRVPVSLARDLLRVEGAHRWVVLLEETERTPEFVAEATSALAGAEAPLQVVPWYDLADFYRQTVALFSRQMGIVRAIVGVVIVLGISNLLIMSVAERTREVGTLLALGLRRRQVMTLFLNEGLALGVIGGTLGCGLGYLLAQALSAVGIPMPPPPGMDVGFTGEIRVTGSLLAGAWLLAVLTTLLASLLPSWYASRLPIVDALRRGR